MATLILTAVGGVVGGRIGGAIGALVGQAVDATLFAPAPRQGARLTELAVQTSSYGAAIPKLFGRVRTSGSVVWSTDLIESRRRQSGGKGRGSTDMYSYAASFAVLLAARRIVRVGRIWADGKLLRGEAGDMKVELAALRVHDGDADQAVDPLIASAEGSDAPAWRGHAYVVFDTLQLAEYGNRIPSLSFEVMADETPVALGRIVASLADVTFDDGPDVIGCAAAGSSVRALAETLGAAFPMSCRDEGGLRGRFAAPGGGALPAADLGARVEPGAAPRTDFRIDPVDHLPGAIAVGYADPARDYQPGLQRAWREGGSGIDERIDLPVVLDASDAHRLAHAVLTRRASERGRATVTLPWRALTLRAGDAVEFAGARWRIATRAFESMIVRLDIVRIAATVDAMGGATAGRAVAERDAPHGGTTLRIVDLPPLADTPATRPMLAVFAGGTSIGWRRAALLVSTDGGTSFHPAGTTQASAIIGVTVGPLAIGNTALIDDVNGVEVELLNAAMTLADADMPSLLAGANRAMIGREMVQFGRASRLSPTRWRLSTLWRGRRGTEDAIVVHGPGTAVVLLEDEAATVLDAGDAVAGARIMAFGIGDVAPYPVVVAATTGRATTPLSPVRLRADPPHEAGVRLHWTRRSRSGWHWPDALDAPLGEEREAYRVDWAGGTVEVGTAEFVYTAALRAADVAVGRTHATFNVSQVGAGGVSPPATLVVPVN